MNILTVCLNMPEEKHSSPQVFQWENIPQEGFVCTFDDVTERVMRMDDNFSGIDLGEYDEVLLLSRSHKMFIKNSVHSITTDRVLEYAEFFERFCMIADDHTEEANEDYADYDITTEGLQITFGSSSSDSGIEMNEGERLAAFIGCYCKQFLGDYFVDIDVYAKNLNNELECTTLKLVKFIDGEPMVLCPKETGNGVRKHKGLPVLDGCTWDEMPEGDGEQ